MKLTYSLILAAASCGMAFGAATAYTTPVGYITATIAGVVGGAPSSDTMVAATLVNASVFTGVSSNDPSSTHEISTTGTLPSGLNSTYYVEITSGVQEGWWSTVASVTGSTITISDAFPSGLAIGTTFTVRPHQTLKGLMGANAAGLITGTDLSADEVQILNPATQNVSAYFYATDADLAGTGLTAGWYNSSGDPSDTAVIEPGTSVLVRHKAAGNLSLVQSGTVKTTKTQVDVFVGDNWVAPMLATGTTLGTCNLNTGNTATGVQQGFDLSVDELQLTNLLQATSAYFAIDPSSGYSGWADASGNPSDSIAIPADQGAVLRRKFASPAIWTAPSQTIAQ